MLASFFKRGAIRQTKGGDDLLFCAYRLRCFARPRLKRAQRRWRPSSLIKTRSPRSDFLATISLDEQQWMKQHSAFLNKRFDQGLIVAHGSVIDLSGGYGKIGMM
jgi:hypothetical protein